MGEGVLWGRGEALGVLDVVGGLVDEALDYDGLAVVVVETFAVEYVLTVGVEAREFFDRPVFYG